MEVEQIGYTLKYGPPNSLRGGRARGLQGSPIVLTQYEHYTCPGYLVHPSNILGYSQMISCWNEVDEGIHKLIQNKIVPQKGTIFTLAIPTGIGPAERNNFAN